MLYSWYILTCETSRQVRRPAHPLDDPLNRPEWVGLVRVFDLAARLKAAHGRRRRRAAQDIERPDIARRA
jgi:hypothetical protein